MKQDVATRHSAMFNLKTFAKNIKDILDFPVILNKYN